MPIHSKRAPAKLSDSSHRGIVAIAVEKIFGLDRQIHPLKSVPEANAFAISTATDFNRRIARYSRTWVDPRVVAVLAIIRFLMGNTASDAIGSSYIVVLLNFASPQVAQAAESARLDRLIGALRTKFRNMI